MYNVMSPKAEEFISDEEIRTCLAYAEKNKNNRAVIEQILEKFNDSQMNVDELGAQVKRASELIKLCREKLRRAEAEVAEALKEE